MFEEGQLYSPVTAGDDGSVTVHLAHDHPGANDPAYRARRSQIAAAALAWQPGEPNPHIDYSETVPELDEVSRRVQPITGFRYLPAAGLVPLREFYGSLEHKRFYSTQYVRHAD